MYFHPKYLLRLLGICLMAVLSTTIGQGKSVQRASLSMPADQPVDSTAINYPLILQRIHQDQLLPFGSEGGAMENKQVAALSKLERQVAKERKLLDRRTGKYTDLDYSDHKRIGVDWMPALGRMRRMTLAYTCPHSKYYLSEALYRDISQALAYFCQFKPLPYCNNWYQQGITRPQTLALCLINMQGAGHQVPDSTLQVTIKAICKDTAVNSAGRNNPLHHYNSGANKSEIALGWIYIGSLIHNAYMLAVGARELYAPLKYTQGEGIQYDRSFDMHYGYLYNGAYGAVLLKSITKGAWYLRGTHYRLAGTQLQFFSDFIIPSIFDQIRGQSMDWNILGRGISRYNVTRPDFSRELHRLPIIDPAHKKNYANVLARMSGKKPADYNIKPSHQHYWHTDFTVHSRPGFYLSLHGVSSRNHAQEIGNQENLKGFWGAEGVMDLMVTGDEYVNIFPLWNWKRLPGATLLDTLVQVKDKAPGSGDRRGTSAFCGGVSDTLNGLTVYTMQNDVGLSGRKAWFMSGNLIYCLGAGIQTEIQTGKKVRTTLNQCYFDSSTEVVLARNGKRSVLPDLIDTVFTAATMPDYILHGQVAYLPFPNLYFQKKSNQAGQKSQLNQNSGTEKTSVKLELKVDQRSSDWQAINSRHYPPVSGKLFELSLNHGTDPKKATYCYAIIPGVKKKFKFGKFLALQAPTVVVNTDSIQGVYFRGSKGQNCLHQIAFYKPGVTYRYYNILVTADQPCLVMLRRVHAKRYGYPMQDKHSHHCYKLSVADPSWQHSALNIQIAVVNEGEKQQNHTYHFKLPVKPYSGSTVSKIIEF